MRVTILAFVWALGVGCASSRQEAAQPKSAQPRTETMQERMDACAEGMDSADTISETPTTTAPDDAGVSDAGAHSGRGLEPEQIRLVVLANVSHFQCCYTVALSADANARGGTTVSFSIAPDGRLSDASIASSSISSEVNTCILNVFRNLKFPASEKPTKAVFPFLFRKP